MWIAPGRAEVLAEAIVRQAIQDYYRLCASSSRYDPDGAAHNLTMRRRRELEAFFCGEWFGVLCKLDGPAIMEAIRLGRIKRQGLSLDGD